MARESHHLTPPNTAITGNNPLENELSVINIEEAPGGTGAPSKAIAWPMKREVEGMGQTQGLKPHPAASVPTLQGRSVRQAVC